MKKPWQRLQNLGLLIAGIALLVSCAQVDLLNATIPTSGYTVFKNVPYEEGARHTLDIYVPVQPAPGHPVVVFYYGGSWKDGNKDNYLFVGQAFASQGILTVIADYRLYPDVFFPAFMEDTAAAFVWTHNNIQTYGGNPHNLFVAGHSAGAYNAIMMTLNRSYLKEAKGKSSWIKGAIGLAGPYDFLPLTDPDVIDIFSKRDLSTSQPINFVHDHVPPMLLATGNEDEDVEPKNSYILAQRLTKFGNQVTLKTYPGVAHIGIILALAKGFRGKAPILDDCITFINSLSVPE